MSRSYKGIKYHPYTTEPKWWRKLMKHMKRRTELKRFINKADWDNTCQPLDTKPRIYYW